jgi:hypothetical protein
MPWDLKLPDGTRQTYPDDVTFEQARSVVMKERPELFPDAPSGFWAGAESGFKRAVGTLGAMPDLALGAILGDEERYKEGIKSLEETERWASDANPNPVSIDDVKKAWEEEGLIGSLDEGWDAAKNIMGESLPYMATMATANRIGGTKAFASLASKRFPSLRTGVQGNVTNRTRKNLAHTMGFSSMLPVFFGENLSRQVDSGAASPEDMNVWTALAAAPLQSALEYVFVALMDPTRGAVRKAAAQSISQFLKHQAIDASSEIPTEMAQTFLERAQDPNLSISLSDAEHIKEVVYAGIAGGVAGAGYGAASTAAQYSGVRKAQEAYQENLKGEEEIRGLINEKIDQNLIREQELIVSGNEEELRMQRVGIDLSTVDQEALEEALSRVADRPVTDQDIHDVANGRNINWDNDPGFMALSKRVTTERDSEGNVIVPGESHIDRMNDDQRRTLYEAVLKFSKQGERVSLPAFIESEYETVLNAHRPQAKKPERIGKKVKSQYGVLTGPPIPGVAAKPAKNLTVASIRKTLNLTNSSEDLAVARGIRNEAKRRGDAVFQDKKLLPIKKDYKEEQYREILETARKRVHSATGKPAPMVTRDIIESVTGKTDILFANRIRNDMISRKDIEKKGTQYFPITLSSILEKRQVSSVPGKGFFIRNEKGRIIGGRRKVRDARTLAKAMEENNTEYLLYQDGELINAYKKPLNKKDPRATVRKAKTRALRAVPGSTVEIVDSSPKYSVSSESETGVEILETGTDLRGDTFRDTIDFVDNQSEANRKKDQLNKDRMGSLPYEERIESLVGEEIKEAKPRAINKRLIKGETLDEEISWREQLAGGVEEALAGMGLGGISLRLANTIRGAEGTTVEGVHNPVLGITLALDRIDTSRPVEDQIDTLIDVVNHELVHDVRSMDLFTEQEWNVLKDYVENKVIPGDPNGATFLEVARVGYGDKTLDEQYEEAIAQAFRYYMKTGKGVAGKPRSLMDRLKNFLTKFLNFLSINEFHSADEVFAAIQEGEIAGRESVIDGKPVIRTIKDIDSPFWQEKLSQLRSKKEDSEQKNRDTSNKITLISGGTEREELPPDRESREVRQLEPSIPEGVSEEEFFEEMPISELVKYSRNPVEWSWEEVQHFNTKENADVGDLMNVYRSTAFVPVKGHDDLKLQVSLYTYMADHGRTMVGREDVLRGKTFASVMFDVYGAGMDSMDPALVRDDRGQLVLASSRDRSFPFKVIATVVDTMQDYVVQEQPDFISFSPATSSLRKFYSNKLDELANALSFQGHPMASVTRDYYPQVSDYVAVEKYVNDGRSFPGLEASQAFDEENKYFDTSFLLRGSDVDAAQRLYPVRESRAIDRTLNMPLHESLPSDIRSRISPSRYREATKLGYPDTDSFIRSVMDKRTKDIFVSDNGEDFNELLSRVFWSEGDPAKKDVNDYVLGYTDRSGDFWNQDETNAIDEAYYAGRFPINTSELDKQSRFNPKPEEFNKLIPDSRREPVDVNDTLDYVKTSWNLLTAPFDTQAPGPGSALAAKYAGTPGVLNKIIYGDPNTGKGGFLWNSYRKLEALGYKPEEYLARREIRIVPPSLDFIDNAFRLPEAARYWYELSGIFFGGTGLSRGYKQRFINLVAATSAQAKPGDNFAKAVAIIAEDMRNLTPSDSELGSVGSPILTGVINAGSVRRALAENEVNGLKFENFAGTLQRMAGVNGDKHIPVIDTMMARIFGINSGDINGTTYFLLADWITQLTELENQAIEQMPDIDTRPYNPWQLQAMMWVHHRIVEDGASGPEDYALVLQELMTRLAKNNFPGNIPINASDIDDTFLRQPRLTASLQPARERYRLHTQTATVETGGGTHAENARASNLVSELLQSYNVLGDTKEDLVLEKKIRKSVDRYYSILRSTMQGLSKKPGKGSKKKPSILEDLLTAITGIDLNLSRVTRDSFGTWDLDVSPNIRIPLTATTSGGRPVRLTAMQRRQFSSVLGIELGQEAMGNTQFVLLDDAESFADARSRVENESPVSIPEEVPNREFGEQTSIWVHGIKANDALWLTRDIVSAIGDKFKNESGETVGGFVEEGTPTGVLLHLIPGDYVKNINIADIQQEIRRLLPDNHIDAFRVMSIMETDAYGNPDLLQQSEYREFDPSLEEIVEGASGTARDTARKNDLLRDVKERIRRAYEEQAKALEAWENDVRNGKKTKSGKISESLMSDLGLSDSQVDPSDGNSMADTQVEEEVDALSSEELEYDEYYDPSIIDEILPPNKHSRVGAIPRINVDASPRAQQIARGEIEGEKLSRNEWKEFELGLNKHSRLDGIPADVEQRTANVISSPKNVTMFSLMNAVLEQDWKKLATTLRAMFVDKYTRIVQIRDQALEIRKGMGMDVERWIIADLDASAATYRAERAAGLLQSVIMRGIPFFARTEATDANGNVIATGGRHTVKDLEIEVMDANGNITMSTGGFYQIMRVLYQNITGKQIQDIWAKYRIAKREARFEAEGRKLPGEQQMSPTDRQYWIDAIEKPKTASDKNVAEIIKMVNRNFDKWNGGFVQYLVDTGVITPEAGEIYTAYNDYIPFYRQWNDDATSAEDQMIESVMSGVHQGRPGMPKAMFGSITGIKTGRKAKGGKQPIVDPMTSILQNSLAAISNGMKNDAAQKVMRDGLLIGDDIVKKLKNKHYDPAKVDYVHEVRENGKIVYYDVKDPLLHSALEGFTEGKLPGLALIAKPATFLREMVTRSPDFIVANLLRDTVSAWTTSGSSHMPFIETLKHMSGNMMNPEASESFQALDRDGLSTGFDLSQRIEGTAGEILKRYKREGVDIGEKDSAWDDIMRVWDWFGDVTTKSDMATRQAVYEDVLKRMRSQGYDTNVAEAEAIFQAGEIINYSRRGNSVVARYLTAAIPFLNARIQGLDVLYRAGMGKYSSDQSKVAQNIARMAFVKRMGFLSAASIIYWMYVHDDDEYRDARPEVRQDNIILPKFGGWLGKVVPNKIPKPFEVGLIAWTIPEIFAEMISGNQDQRQTVNALKRGLETTLAFNPIPQAIKPAFEAYNNLSYFTGREIVPHFQGDRSPQLQHRPGTNVLAMALGEMFNESPSKIEHILRGYTGTIGSYVLFAADSAIRPHTDYPSTPELRLDQYPMLRRFFQSDLGGGQLAEFYEFREASEEVTNSISALRGDHRHKEANRIVNENMGIIRTQSRRKGMDRVLANLRSHRMRILLDRRMGDAEKTRQLRAIQEREKAVLHDLQATRKRADLPVDLPFPFSVFERG